MGAAAFNAEIQDIGSAKKGIAGVMKVQIIYMS